MDIGQRVLTGLKRAGSLLEKAWGAEARALEGMEDNPLRRTPPPGFGRYPGLAAGLAYVWGAEARALGYMAERHDAAKAETHSTLDT